jgi:hypothetical protein
MRRCRTRKTANSGRMPRIEDAIVSAYWMAEPPINPLSPTGMVWDLVWVSTSRGHRKAFQVVMKVRMATAETAGRHSGMQIWR